MDKVGICNPGDSLKADPLSAYSMQPLLNLIRLIAEDSDPLALQEFLERRTVFRWGAGPRLLLIEYVFKLRDHAFSQWHHPRASELADQAYSLTVDKFSRLRSDDEVQKGSGPDCRRYFAAVLRRCQNMQARGASALEKEAEMATLLQEAVQRHYFLSCKEVGRQLHPYTHRYCWKFNGQALRLYMPRRMTGDEKRAWLEKRFSLPRQDAMPSRAQAQAIIDEELIECFRKEINAAHVRTRRAGITALPWSMLYGTSTDGMAGLLAEEKANQIQKLRPSIQALGVDALKRLIVEVFAHLHRGQYNEGALARAYGLSRSAFSRFAGSQWHKSEKSRSVPALWANFAELLSGNPVFVEAAKAADVWELVTSAKEQSAAQVSSCPKKEC